VHVIDLELVANHHRTGPPLDPTSGRRTLAGWLLDNSGYSYTARMKQVLVVNSALALQPGKMAAQVAHASIAAFLSADDANRQKWLEVGMPKIVLDGGAEAQIRRLLR
jgi:hypothetical protein